MDKLVENFAQISGQRDREVLDLSIAQLVFDLLQPQHVAVHRCVGHGEHARWLRTASLLEGRGQAAPGLGEVDFDALPRLADLPEHAQCLASGQPAHVQAPMPACLWPLSAGNAPVGVLEVATLAPLSADQQSLLGSMARFYRNLCGLLEENESDALTGLRNRKSFDEAFVRLAYQPGTQRDSGDERRRPEDDTRGWLAVIDIDHFKQVNDRFGHLIGDEVLLLLARLMRETFRHDDLVYRFGGEEFVALMRTGGEPDAHAALQRLRRAVEAFDFPQVGRITVSIGFTRVCEDDMPTDAFDRADQAVYWVKQNGRNGVLSHDELRRLNGLGTEEAKGGVDFF